MPSIAIVHGALLILIGVLGYVYSVANNTASMTALIPAIIGVLIALLGLGARSSENLRKHLMHAAVVIALLGFLAVAGRLIPRLSELTFSVAVVSQIATALICFMFVVIAVRSFIAARKNA